MRWLWLVALVACNSTTSRNGVDAATDSRQFLDARIDGPPPLDAYVPRACDAPATFADGFVLGRVLHVEAGAVGGDGSAEHPFGSIAEAAVAARPGTFIQVAPAPSGRLHAANQFIPNLTGTADAPIVIGGVWGTQPVISHGSEGIHLTNPHYVVIQNLEISMHTANGINIDDGVTHSGEAGPVALINVNVHDMSAADSGCIRASGVRGLSVYDSWLRRCSNGIEAIGVRDSVFARNIFHAQTNTAVRVRGGSADVDIRQNRISDAGGNAINLGGATPLSQFRPPLSTTTPNAEARRIRAFDNVIVDDVLSGVAFDGCVDCLFAHNLVYGRPSRLIRIAQTTNTQSGYTFEGTRNGRVINNSFTWSQNVFLMHVEVALGASGSTFTFSHNLWNNFDAPANSRPQLPVPEDGQVANQGTGYEPMLYPAYCYGPEGGTAAPLPEIDGTIEGFCRSMGDAPTIGPQMLQGAACAL